MANISVNINVDNSKLFAAMARYSKEFGKTEEDVVKWAAIRIARSMGGATRQSKKLRKIVKNPDERSVTDRRRANFGVWKYRGDRSRRFVPIYRGGEFGGIRFVNKKTGEQLQRDRITGEVYRVKFSLLDAQSMGGIGITNNPKRNINRSGLAKKSWRAMAQRVNTGGSSSAMGVSNVATVKNRKEFGAYEVKLSNRLKYAKDAIDRSKYSTVLTKAANGMNKIMDQRIKAKLKRARLK